MITYVKQDNKKEKHQIKKKTQNTRGQKRLNNNNKSCYGRKNITPKSEKARNCRELGTVPLLGGKNGP